MMQISKVLEEFFPTECGGDFIRIGELAQRTQVPTRLLRYYEEQGLLSPMRAENGYRIYCETSVTRVQQIRGLLDAGLSTRTIRSFLPCLRQSDDSSLPPTCVTPEVAGALQQEAEKIQKLIDSLTRSRDALKAYLATLHPALKSDPARAAKREGRPQSSLASPFRGR
ncbi:MerR family transcriptional regulator [Streptomyces sioyaensis]|uniref:MerR family transcriptional regulator n=1 Tax=Streptomyces sioyaensis TaxID=67364 RepID=UPI0037D43127